MTTPSPQIQSKANPASPTPAEAPKRRRVPMSTPTRKLEVPEIPGYYLYWFRDENVPRALQAGYEFVLAPEVNLNPINVANDRSVSGNTDLGNHVTLVNGTTDNGRAVVATLMKLKQEFHDEDQKEIDERNFAIIKNIFSGEYVGRPGEAPVGDQDHRYVKTAVLNRPVRKAKLVGPR